MFLFLFLKNGTKPKLADDVTLQSIGCDARLDGYTGADLSSLVKESAVQALQEFVFNQDHPTPDVRVHLRHFHTAIDKIRPSVNEKVKCFTLKLHCKYNKFYFRLVFKGSYILYFHDDEVVNVFLYVLTFHYTAS